MEIAARHDRQATDPGGSRTRHSAETEFATDAHKKRSPATVGALFTADASGPHGRHASA
jgi:hypothetical protein